VTDGFSITQTAIMNCLAHIYLSGNNEELLFGNFIGDGVKGNQIEDYTPEIQAGINLHRFIDHYTDSHDITAEARKIIRPDFRKYAGVVLDVYFDYFLGNSWENFHPTPLPQFVSHAHRVLDEYEPKMPEKTQVFFKYMKQYNWLLNYRNQQVLDRVFNGMAQRTPFKSNMEQGVIVLKRNEAALSEAFESFFPDLKLAVNDYLADPKDLLIKKQL
jgi:acyl carrier protein phosphodiesterase